MRLTRGLLGEGRFEVPYPPGSNATAGTAAETGEWATARLYGRSNPVNVSHMWVKQRARVDPLSEFNDVDRAWRKRYLAESKLTANDGWSAHVQTMKEYEKAQYNWLRRIGRMPMTLFQNTLISSGMMTHGKAIFTRKALCGVAKGLTGLWIVTYLAINNLNSWESRLGVKMYHNRPDMDPESKYYEDQKARFVREKPDDWYNQGFKKSSMFGQKSSQGWVQ